MSYADTARKATALGSIVASVNVTLNSTIAGNLVICGTSSYDGGGFSMDAVITDGGNTWTKSFKQQDPGTSNQCANLSYSVLGTGGNRTINSDPGINTNYDIAVFVHEFSGPHTTPASGTPVGAGAASGTTASTGSMTPADNDVLVIAVLASTNPMTITENAGSEGFSLSNENEVGGDGDRGSMVFKIISGAPGTPSHSWTLGNSTRWECGIAALKPLTGSSTYILGAATMA
jgi:hypothetical protein